MSVAGNLRAAGALVAAGHARGGRTMARVVDGRLCYCALGAIGAVLGQESGMMMTLEARYLAQAIAPGAAQDRIATSLIISFSDAEATADVVAAFECAAQLAEEGEP